MPYFMVFDVESVGLHGEGYAVGWVVLNEDGRNLGDGYFACNPLIAFGSDEGRDWVNKNIPLIYPTHQSPKDVRSAFWRVWKAWKPLDTIIVADCGWPVEARFLAQCIDDDQSRMWEGPYPLHELASFRFVAGSDPLAVEQRFKNELPVHNPLADARQSARLFMEAIAFIESKKREYNVL